MVRSRSPTFKVRVLGELACFTRPELKVERVSYPVMTPSAARGVLESVLWKPAIRWRVERIHVLAPIRFVTVKRNEVNSKASPPKAETIAHGGDYRPFFADEDRAQRNTMALADVDYLVEAHFFMTECAGPEDNLTKFVEMFQRRLQRGQCFQQPYLGCREFAAHLRPGEMGPPPIDEDRDLGWMLWDIDHDGPDGRVARFFKATLKKGVLAVPERPDDGLDVEGGAS